MAIPKFEEFLYPFLLATNNKDMTVSEMRQYIVDYFHLTEEDCSLRTKSGNTTQVADRLNWVRQYLRRAQMIDLRKQDLMAYPEFASYATGMSVSTPTFSANTSSQDVVNEDLTPTEQLEQAYHSIIDDLAADLLQKTLEQSPYFFEHLVVDLLVKMGYGGSFANSAQVTQYVHDDGIDGIIYEDKLGLDKLNKKIVLIDGQELARYMIEYNVGVSTKQVYEVKRIDSDYFEE